MKSRYSDDLSVIFVGWRGRKGAKKPYFFDSEGLGSATVRVFIQSLEGAFSETELPRVRASRKLKEHDVTIYSLPMYGMGVP